MNSHYESNLKKYPSLWKQICKLSYRIPNSVELLHLYYLDKFPLKLNQKQFSIETLRDKTLENPTCFLCGLPFRENDSRHHLITSCEITEKVWDQLDLEPYQHHKSDKYISKMNQYLQCCHPIYRLLSAQSDGPVDLSDGIVSNLVRYFTTYLERFFELDFKKNLLKIILKIYIKPVVVFFYLALPLKLKEYNSRIL